MVLCAASTDGETPPDEPTGFLQAFCKIQKITEAQLVLTRAMDTDHSCTVQVSMGVVTALQRGVWLWTHLNVPSNLTTLAVHRPNGYVEESVHDLVLAMKPETPTLFNESDMKKVTRQPLSFPCGFGYQHSSGPFREHGWPSGTPSRQTLPPHLFRTTLGAASSRPLHT
jgi:hypothetical protein